MILGTHSSAGKSLLVTAFCRILSRKGYRVAPFKAQNMSNNAGVTPEGGEMGRAQIVQAEAAGVAPHADMNPVLLKPEGNRRSQIVLNGKVYGHIDARNWMDIKRLLWDEVRAAYDRLAARFEVIVLEGAGSPAEINLKAGDIVNLRMACYARAPALLVGDIDRGGVFAALAGTMLLLEPEEREQVRGFLMNKFRGDPSLLGDGLRMLQERAFGVPTLGVIPFLNDLWVAEEDAVALERLEARRGVSGGQAVEIVVIYLPRISNLDEYDALAAEPGVRVRFVRRPEEIDQPRAIILPGTKATLSDLRWLRAQGLDQVILRLRAKGSSVVGVCGGYQMLGERLSDPSGIEEPAGTEAVGLGLLPVETVFNQKKQTDQVRIRLSEGEFLSGYEIHAGETRLMQGAEPLGVVFERGGRPADEISGAKSEDGGVWGTYLHDIFANNAFRHRWLRSLGWKGEGGDTAALREAAYDRLADAVEASVNWPQIARIVGLA